MTTPVIAALRAAGAEFQLAKTSVLVAVSGGPDSVALLLGLAELREEFQLDLSAAHVNHGWRGAESDADAEWVQELGNQLHIATEILAIQPEMTAAHAGESREEAARNLRYELLTRHAEQAECPVIAFGHTADDQVETVLHQLLRGTGLSGLAGMPSMRSLSERIHLIRPLLGARRDDVLEYLVERNQSYRVDATNADVALTRNRVRLELLPLLREKFNPQVDEALLRLAEQAAEAAHVLDGLADSLLQTALLEETGASCRLDVHQLTNQPEPLIRQTLRRLWIRRNWPRKEMGQREWQRLGALVFQPGAVDLPGGIHARRESGPLVLTKR